MYNVFFVTFCNILYYTFKTRLDTCTRHKCEEIHEKHMETDGHDASVMSGLHVIMS